MKYTLDVNYESGSGNYEIELTIDPNKKYLNFNKNYKDFDEVFNSIKLDQYQLTGPMTKKVEFSPGFLKDSGFINNTVKYGLDRTWKNFRDNYLPYIYFEFKINGNLLSLKVADKIENNGNIDPNLVQFIR